MEQIDAALQLWNQGDCVLEGEHWLAFGNIDETTYQVEEDQVAGFVVTTQTCDIVRSCSVRPWIEICPLVSVPAAQLDLVRQEQIIQYAYMPMLAARSLVADLDRSMTVHKRVVASWKREPGGFDDTSSRAFARALSRKRSRKAFPDDFTELVSKLRKFIKDKHGKDSTDGHALVDLREIRVSASPNWDAPQVELTFWFIWNEWTALSREGRAGAAARWCAKVTAGGRFVSVRHLGLLLADMRADEYVDADSMDLDYLSHTEE